MPNLKNFVVLLIIAGITSCSPLPSSKDLSESINKIKSYNKLNKCSQRLFRQYRDHEKILSLLSDSAKIRYLLCFQQEIPEKLFKKMIKALRFNSISSVLDLFPSRDAKFIRKLRQLKYHYFEIRYPGNYYGNEESTNYEYEIYFRRVIEEYMYHFNDYDKDGKIALAHLLHNALIIGGNWEYVPGYMKRELAGYIMNMVPGATNKASLENPEQWYAEEGLAALAIDMVSRSGYKMYAYDIKGFIEKTARDADDRKTGFEALSRLHANGSYIEYFLIQALKNKKWKDNTREIINAIAETKSETLDKYLLPFIGGDDFNLWTMAAHTYWRLPNFKKRIKSLSREKQVQIMLMGKDTTDTMSNNPFMKEIHPEDAQILINTFKFNSYRDFVCVTRQAVFLLGKQKNKKTIKAVIQLLDELEKTGEGLELWMLFGFGVEYLEDVSGVKFWNPDYPHSVTGQSDKHAHTSKELKETMEKIHKWWNANKDKFPTQLMPELQKKK